MSKPILGGEEEFYGHRLAPLKQRIPKRSRIRAKGWVANVRPSAKKKPERKHELKKPSPAVEPKKDELFKLLPAACIKKTYP